MKPHLWFTLYSLLKLGASKKPVKISTTELAEVMGSSQQSASRHLQVLERDGFIRRRMGPGGSLLEITGEGLGELSHVLHELGWHIEGGEAEAVVLEGEVVSGLFEGAYYVSKEGYGSQIVEKLGFEAFPGTLNLMIREEDHELRRQVEKGPSVRLEGFRDGERAFGAANCYGLLLNDEVEGAMIVAERTSHDMSIMEVIAPVYLRRRFSLADGDTVKVAFLPQRGA